MPSETSPLPPHATPNAEPGFVQTPAPLSDYRISQEITFTDSKGVRWRGVVMDIREGVVFVGVLGLPYLVPIGAGDVVLAGVLSHLGAQFPGYAATSALALVSPSPPPEPSDHA